MRWHSFGPHGGQLSASPEFLGYDVCRCARGYYGLPPDECVDCPPHGNCSEGGATVTWKRGFYPIFNRCTHAAATHIALHT
jgi:hypothetical protein